MGSERQIQCDAAETVGELVDDVAPEVGVGEPAVGEDQHWSFATFEVLQIARGEVHLFDRAEKG